MTSGRCDGSNSSNDCDNTRQNCSYAVPPSRASAASTVGTGDAVGLPTGANVGEEDLVGAEAGATATDPTVAIGGAAVVTTTGVGTAVGTTVCVGATVGGCVAAGAAA